MSHAFWVREPHRLISDFTIIPHRDMQEEEILNVLTRLVIVIAIVLLLFKAKDWWVFLLGGIVLIFFLWYVTPNKDDSSERIEHYRCRRDNNGKRIIQKHDVNFINIRPRYR